VTVIRQVFAPSAKKRYPAALTSHQRWLVSLSAILAERTPGHSHTTLYPLDRINKAISKARLRASWDITSPKSLSAILDWLAAEGHRTEMAPVIGHPPLAWDIGRYADIVRYSFAAGYVNESQAWQLLRSAAQLAAPAYGSWKGFADDFMTGRQLWMRAQAGTADENWAVSQEVTARAAQRLTDPANEQSPWRITPWEIIYQPDV
jgi:hypothetical protein